MPSIRAMAGVALVSAWFAVLSLQVPAQSSPHRAPYTRPLTTPQPAAVPGAQVDVISGNQKWKSDLESAPSGSQKSSRARALSVDVINGSARRTQVFDEEQSSVLPKGQGSEERKRKHTAQRKVEAAPEVPDVEVINGSHLETRRFEGAEDELSIPWIERRDDRPVVIGVSSVASANRPGGSAVTGSTASVVVGVASSEAEGSGAKPVAYRVSPGPPRRPPYHPGPPGF